MKDPKNIPACPCCTVDLDDRICRKARGSFPDNCPTINCSKIVKESLREFKNKDLREFARQASVQEAEGYADRELGYQRVKPVKPRIVEIMEFAHRMQFKRLGLAYCNGLRIEAEKIHELLTGKGFQLVSVVCKVGGIPKEEIGIRDNEKISIGGFESMCNPIAQAAILNRYQTEFNILLGLCVGHDSLFLKYSEAPCTVLAVKDRVMGHNPLAAVYTLDSYYRSLK